MRTMINMLPASFRRQQIAAEPRGAVDDDHRRRARHGWGWHWIEMREQTHLSQQLEVLSREHAPTQTMLKQLVDMRQQLKELHAARIGGQRTGNTAKCAHAAGRDQRHGSENRRGGCA